MPGRDRTGPSGEGPLTGRGAGFCAGGTGLRQDASATQQGAPYGLGRGGRNARGRGLGRGYRARYWMQAGPAWRTEPDTDSLDQGEETRLLRAEAEHLRSALEAIDRRLEQLETT